MIPTMTATTVVKTMIDVVMVMMLTVVTMNEQKREMMMFQWRTY